MPRREPRARPARGQRRGAAPISPRYLPRSLLVGLVLLTALACDAGPSRGGGSTSGGATETATDTVVDASGTAHVFTRPAQRIVSLVPSATNTLRALGAEGSLVGRTDYDTAAWAADIPSVGGGLDPNLEAILVLRPDLVIRFGGEQDPRTPARLDEMDIRHIDVRPTSIDGIFRTTEIVGRVTGHEQAADSLARSIRDGLAALEARVADMPRLRVAYVLGGSPPWVSGPGTYIDEILALAGGDNVFADLRSPYTSVSPETLLTRGIEVVLVSNTGALGEGLAAGARVEVIGDALENPGPGVVEAAWAVAEAMHGQALR